MDEAEQIAQTIWTYGSNDEEWNAVFERGVDVAAELLTRIENSTDFAVGDLTHDEVIARIHRRYPILNPNPGFTSAS